MTMILVSYFTQFLVSSSDPPPPPPPPMTSLQMGMMAPQQHMAMPAGHIMSPQGYIMQGQVTQPAPPGTHQQQQMQIIQMQQNLLNPAMNDAPLEFNMNKNKPPMPVSGK